MNKLWLIFAQCVTVALALLLVVTTLRPDLLPVRTMGSGNSVVTIRESGAAGSGGTATSSSVSYHGGVRAAVPSIVNIFTSKEMRRPKHPLMDDPLFRRFFGEPESEAQRSSSLGSGVIVGVEGYVITNNHVVEAADEIQVALNDGRQALAKVVGVDPESDLAVLKINLGDLPVVTFAQSDKLQVGDVVLAIGNPFGVGQTVTMGIVSALGRSHLGINTFENFIQTDAAINPGNSGGALIDASGHLVGINTAIYSGTGGSMGIGFAIPVSLARQVMEQIIQSGSVTRGWIGVGVQDLNSELAESFQLPDTKGVLIASVMPGSPAAKSGIRPGDVLLSVDGKPLPDSSVILNVIAAVAPGKTTSVKLLRHGKPVELKVLVGKRPAPQPHEEEE
ncbi:MAG: Do family serine endopeptidase [Betaproteobacteria bacterium]|nr:Do family serine endopeptidase [Betaproteobacteria bacterium]